MAQQATRPPKLADILADVRDKPRFKPNVCNARQALDSLDDEDREALQAVFDDKRLTHAAIVRWLKQAEIPCGVTSVTRHRNGTCRCFADG